MDAQLFHWIYGWLHQPSLYPVMSGLTHLGDFKVVLTLATLGILESAVTRARRRGRLPLLPWLGIPIAAGVTHWLKGVVGRPRPVELVPALGLLSSEMGRSFPSGHATLIFALAGALSFRWPKGRIGWMGLATLVAITRVGLGLHWPTDLVAGALIGWGLVVGLAWVEQKLKEV